MARLSPECGILAALSVESRVAIGCVNVACTNVACAIDACLGVVADARLRVAAPNSKVQ